jgi:hypothetical protein
MGQPEFDPVERELVLFARAVLASYQKHIHPWIRPEPLMNPSSARRFGFDVQVLCRAMNEQLKEIAGR